MSQPEVTRTLARWIVSCQPGDVPQPVKDEAVRTFFNWLGCAVGGSGHETLDAALDAVRLFAGPAQATVLGRRERFDVLHAALLNGISSHVLDYDDTHLKTIIHPAGPVASALLAVAEMQAVSGADSLHALTIGVEVECRIGNCVYPEHYDRGWHITGTAGVFGAAAAVGKLLGLDETRMVWALGLAATQSSGLREMFGTMTKSFHPGRAAQNGAMAAFLARSGFDSSLRGIEAPRGFANVLSTKQDYTEITGGLGETWEAGLNTYKPFACGIVIHPTIDGCSQLRDETGGAEVERLDVVVHPLVLELTGKTEPATGLEGKFSVFHSAAWALLHGDGSPTAFTDQAVNDPAAVALRRRVHVETSRDVKEEQVRLVLTLKDGRRVERFVEHAIGSLERPLSREMLVTKFSRQAVPTLSEDECKHLMDLAWALPTLADAAEVARAAVPGSGAQKH